MCTDSIVITLVMSHLTEKIAFNIFLALMIPARPLIIKRSYISLSHQSLKREILSLAKSLNRLKISP